MACLVTTMSAGRSGGSGMSYVPVQEEGDLVGRHRVDQARSVDGCESVTVGVEIWGMLPFEGIAASSLSTNASLRLVELFSRDVDCVIRSKTYVISLHECS